MNFQGTTLTLTIRCFNLLFSAIAIANRQNAITSQDISEQLNIVTWTERTIEISLEYGTPRFLS